MEARCEHWNVKIKEDKTQAIYFSHGNRPVESHLALKERNILFVSNVKYLGEFRQKRSMVTTYTKDWSQGLYNIYKYLLPIQKGAFMH